MKVVLLTAAAAAILLAYYAEADSQFKACRNRISGCGRRARLGHCKTKKRFMTKNCAKRCGFCGPQKSTAAPTNPPSGAPTGNPTQGPTNPPVPGGCGNPAVQGQRVVGGVDATPGAWPWQILMLMGGQAGCGGSIVGPRHVVTAAHCVYQRASAPKYFKVRVGEHDRLKSSGNEVDYAVKRVIVHPRWSPMYMDYDIAMFELEKPIKFGKYVSPVCLPNKNVNPGTVCYITGWGKTQHPGSMTTTLQQAVMPIVSNAACYLKNKNVIPVPITERMICSGDGGESRRSGCHGDSGGPLVCKVGGRWELHGAVSHGSPRCASTDTYTVFSRISFFKDWIVRNMK